MTPFSWDSFGENEINEKIKYWVDLWEEIIEDFSRITYDRELINPHLLIINILDEIKYNKLKNDNNNAYFKEKLKVFANDDVIKNILYTDFELLISELSQKSNRFEYFSALCKETLKIFQSGIYFKESCNLLKATIFDSQWKKNDEEKISSISQNLIIELMLAGYGIETIRTIPRELFARTKADTRSISDRIERLKNYFDKEPIEGYGVFHIDGLKGNVNVNVGEVNFYSPQLENYWRFINNPEIEVIDFDELKLRFYDEEIPYFERITEKIAYRDLESKIKQVSFVNAAVKIRYRDFESAKRQALEAIDTSLDILSLYMYPEMPFKIKLNKFYFVSCEDLRVYDYFSQEATPYYKSISSFNLNKTSFFSEKNGEFLSGLKELLFNEEFKSDPLSAKLIYSLHWYRKALETDIPEDQLLNYWIAIENLFTFDSKNGNLVVMNKEEKDKFVLIEDLVPCVELSYSIKDVATDIYYYLKTNIKTLLIENDLNSFEKQPQIPRHILRTCQLEPCLEPKEVNLKEFIQNLHLLDQYITRKVIKDKISYAEKFYTDTEFKSLELQRKIQQIRQDLLLIYRYRNFIVHNAHFDHNILPYYVMKAGNLARNLLDKILYEHIKDNKKSHQEILIWEKVKMERIIAKLKNKTPIVLWEIL